MYNHNVEKKTTTATTRPGGGGVGAIIFVCFPLPPLFPGIKERHKKVRGRRGEMKRMMQAGGEILSSTFFPWYLVSPSSEQYYLPPLLPPSFFGDGKNCVKTAFPFLSFSSPLHFPLLLPLAFMCVCWRRRKNGLARRRMEGNKTLPLLLSGLSFSFLFSFTR